MLMDGLGSTSCFLLDKPLACSLTGGLFAVQCRWVSPSMGLYCWHSCGF